MFAGHISDREKFRLELEQHIETAKNLINSASAQGRDARDLQKVGAHLLAALKSLNRHGPIEAEAVAVPTDPPRQDSATVTAVLTVMGAMQEAIAVAELLILKIETGTVRPELVDLVARLRAVDTSMRILAAAVVNMAQ
jgi:hypothetical protein